MTFRIFYICTILAIPFLILAGCSGSSGEGQQNENKLVPAVEAVQAKFGNLPLTERLSGIVKAKNQVAMYPEITAVVTRVYVENGELVSKGQPLIQLRDKEFQERLKQAKAGYQITVAQAKQSEASYNETQSNLKRTQSLIDKNLASPNELENIKTLAISAEADFDLAKARVEQAAATVEEVQEALAHTIIRAPVDGTVGGRNAEIGMLVNNNARVFTIGQLDSVRISIILTDRMLSYLKPGQTTEIISENLPFGKASSKLSRISPFLNPVTHSTDAEIDMTNTDRALNPGMFVTVDIQYGESEQATLVPISAIYENPTNGETGVYVSMDSLEGEAVAKVSDASSIALSNPVSFRFVPVEIVARGRLSAGVRGIEPGSWVITLGQDLLRGQDGSARVRKVKWAWVEELQQLQREDLLQDVLNRQQEAVADTTSSL